MSIRLMTEVWAKEVDGYEQSILLVMADYANDDGSSVFPSMGVVAWKVGVSKRTAQRWVKSLRDKGALVKVADARQHHPVEYRIDLSALPNKAAYVPPNQGRQDGTPAPDRGRQSGQLGVTDTAARDDTAAPPEPPVVEPPEEPPTEAPDGARVVWERVVTLTDPRSRELTPSRRRMIERGLGEATIEECCRAVEGRVAWIAANKPGQRFELSSVFQTRPGGSPLREQIDFYIEQAPSATPPAPSGFPSASSARIERAKDEVRMATEMDGSHTAQVRGERATEWLKEHGVGVRYEDDRPVFYTLDAPPEAA